MVGGELYAIGGDGEAGLEFYDPHADSWREAFKPTWNDWASNHDASSRSRYFGASIVSDGSIYYIGGTYDALTPYIDVYEAYRHSWKDFIAPTMTNARYGRIGFSAVIYNGAVFVIGGMMQAWGAASLASDDVCAFVPSTMYQYDETDLPQPRAGLGAAVLNHHLYVVGGYAKHAETGALQTFGGMWRYTPGEWTTTNPWGEPLASLNVPRHSFGTAELEGKLYVAGGVDAQGRLLDSVEEYDPAHNAWVLKAPMSAPRAHLALVAFGDRLFALGGYDPAGRQSRGVAVFRP
ncbi:N-acetylneuraminate epimerase [compost metagenome]